MKDFCFRADFYDGRLNIIARHIEHVSAENNFATLFLCLINSFSEGYDLCLSVQRSNQGRGVQRIANFDCLISSHHSCCHLIEDLILYQHSAQGCAPLTTSASCCKDATLEGHVQISVSHNNRAIIASKLKDSSAKAGSYFSGHMSPCFG